MLSTRTLSRTTRGCVNTHKSPRCWDCPVWKGQALWGNYEMFWRIVELFRHSKTLLRWYPDKNSTSQPRRLMPKEFLNLPWLHLWWPPASIIHSKHWRGHSLFTENEGGVRWPTFFFHVLLVPMVCWIHISSSMYVSDLKADYLNAPIWKTWSVSNWKSPLCKAHFRLKSSFSEVGSGWPVTKSKIEWQLNLFIEDLLRIVLRFSTSSIASLRHVFWGWLHVRHPKTWVKGWNQASANAFHLGSELVCLC